MFDNMARQVMRDAETFACNEGAYVHLHHVTKALLTGQGISNTVLKSFGLTKDNVPQVPGTDTRRFFTPWRTSDDGIYVGNYSPDVVAVWYHAQCLQSAKGRSDATEFFLLGLLKDGGAYSKQLREEFGFTLEQAEKRIEHLQAVSLWSGFEPEAHARRFLSLAQSELRDGNADEAMRLVKRAISEIRQAKNDKDHRLLMARAQVVKQAARFFKTAGHQIRARRYEKLAQALSADVLKREDDNWRANQLGFNH